MDYSDYKDANIWFLDNEIRFPNGIKFSTRTNNKHFIEIQELPKDLALSYFNFTKNLWSRRHSLDVPICPLCSNPSSDDFELDGCNHKQLYSEYINRISQLAMGKFVEDLLVSAGENEEEVMKILEQVKHNMVNHRLSYILNSSDYNYVINQDMYPCGPIYSEK